MDALPKFDPTEYSGIAIASALDRRHAGAGIFAGKNTPNNNQTMVTDKSSNQNSSASFQFGGYVSQKTSEKTGSAIANSSPIQGGGLADYEMMSSNNG